MNKNNRGFTFIITVIIIIGLITMLLLLIKPVNETNDNSTRIVNNYKNEFDVLIKQSDLNSTIVDNFNNSFSKYINSKNHKSEICNIIQTEEKIFLSNYTGKECNIYFDSDFNQIISDKTTITIDNFINKTNIYLCNCTLINASEYYIKIYNSENQIISTNN